MELWASEVALKQSNMANREGPEVIDDVEEHACLVGVGCGQCQAVPVQGESSGRGGTAACDGGGTGRGQFALELLR